MRKEILLSQQPITNNQQPTTPIRERIIEMIEEEIARIVAAHTAGYRSDWNTEEIFEEFKAIAGVANEAHAKLETIREGSGDDDDAREEIKQYFLDTLRGLYNAKIMAVGDEGMRNLEKVTLLQTIDMLWMDHLDTMAHLRDSVRLRAYGQRDPLVEYKNEGVKLFRELQGAIRAQVVGTIFKVGLAQQTTNNQQPTTRTPNLVFQSSENQPSVFGVNKHGAEIYGQKAENKKQVVSNSHGRNDPCPCGATHSDGRPKKYKRCHGM